MEEIEYVKIDKNFLMKQWHKLNNEIVKREKGDYTDSYNQERLCKCRHSLQDLSFIISKTAPL